MNRWKLLTLFILLCVIGGMACFAWRPPRGASGGPADKVLVLKSRREMALLRDGHELCRYRVALGRSPVGPKMRVGDDKAPEGSYVLDSLKRGSSFHVAMHVSYPNSEDRERAAKQRVDPGGLIMVHGIKNGLGWLGRLHRTVDWTDGCIALTDAEMDQFCSLVPAGTPIEIRP